MKLETTTVSSIDPREEIPFIGNYTTNDIFKASRKLPPCSMFDPSKLGVQASNTYTSALNPSWLQPDAVEQIVASFAPVASFLRVFDPAPYAPFATNVIKFVTQASTTLTEATGSPIATFNTGDGVISAVSVPVTHYSQPWHVTNTEFQSGNRIEDYFLANALALASTVAGNIATNFTTANFSNKITSAPDAFGLGDAGILQGLLKKSPKRSLVLDGEYYSKLTHVAGFGDSTNYGWTGIFNQSAGWTSAGPKVRGIACNPQAIVVVTGVLLPQRSPIISQQYMTLGQTGLLVEYNRWLDPATRTQWASLDLVLGSAPADTTAGALVLAP